MNPWIRLYRESLHDPKIVTLSDRQFRAWHNCLLIADDAGRLPCMRDIAVHMRVTITDAQQLVCELVEAQLVDPVVTGEATTYGIHGWSKRQYASDNSQDRVRKHREKKKNNSRNGDVTAGDRYGNGDETPPEPDTDTDTETDSDQKSRERAKSDFGLKIVTGSPVAEVERELLSRAEGLGLNAKSLAFEAERPGVKNPSAYFQSLVRKRLREMVPSLSDDAIGRGLCGDRKAYGGLMNIIMLAETAR